MDATKILQQGEEAKFLIDIEHEGFDIGEDNFDVTLTWGLAGQSLTIPKSEMVVGDQDTYLFTFDSSDMLGRVTAECSYYIPDDNYSDGYRTEVDRQILCIITPVASPKYVFCPVDDSEHDVTYTRVTTASVAVTYTQLCTRYNEPLVTADDQYIYVQGSDIPVYVLTQTGPEVQALLNSIDNLETRVSTLENS